MQVTGVPFRHEATVEYFCRVGVARDAHARKQMAVGMGAQNQGSRMLEYSIGKLMNGTLSMMHCTQRVRFDL